MKGQDQHRDELVLSVLFYLGERKLGESVSLHTMAEALDVSLLDMIWVVVLLGRAGYLEYETRSPIQVTLTRDLKDIGIYTLAEDIQEIPEFE